MSSNAERFGQIVLARRKALGLTQLEVDADGGPSNTKQTEIEAGELPSLFPNMAKKLDAGLQWEKGSAQRTWLGGDPTPLESLDVDFVARVAEIERSNISESTKRWLIKRLRDEQHENTEAGEVG